MNILSLFDGISCGRLALERVNMPIDNYYAYEIEPNAIAISKYNYPNITQLGDVTKADFTQYNGKIDLLMGGSPCFAKGTMIKTIEGFKEIQDIKIGDLVLTHTGSYKKVYNIMNRIADNYCIVSGESVEKIICTPNHAFYTKTMNRIYEKSKAKRKLSQNFSWTSVKDFQKQYKKNTILTHTYLCSVTDIVEYNPVYNGIEIKNNQFTKRLSNKLNLQDENLWYIIGRYLGDGWLRYKYKKGKKFLSGIVICCGKTEKEELENRIKATKLPYSISEERTVFRFTLTNLELATYLLQFGKGAKNKHLIQDVYFLPKKLMEYFLKGYLEADGCKGNSYYTYTSVSKELAYGIKYCLTKFTNRPCNLHLYKGRTHIMENRQITGSDIYSGSISLKETKQKHYFVENNYIFTPFTKIEYINEPIQVYNFSVEEDESYTANGLVVHNCTNFSQAKCHTAKLKKETDINQGIGWKLFMEYVRAKKESNPTYFLYENNYRISKSIKNAISKELGVEPLLINSATVSAQNRKRLYWTNIPNITQPKDKGILVKDIIVNDDSLIKHFDNRIRNTMIKCNNYIKYDLGGKGHYSQQDRLYFLNKKAPTVPRSRTETKFNVYLGDETYKKTCPIEIERLQTLPDNYTKYGVNNKGETKEIPKTKRFEAIGNGWTVDVIAHILNFLPKEYTNEN